MQDNTFNAPLSPIRRSTPSQRLFVFQRNEYQIYNKYSPYYQAGGDLGNDSPYIYTRLTDPTSAKELTRYDTQGVAAGSTVRDVRRIAKFSASGRGILFYGQQILLQGGAAFDETRTYNAGSLLSAAGRTLPLAVTERPFRHIESNGGLLNFFITSLLTSVGARARDMTNAGPIPGTATGALSNVVKSHGGGRYGVVRGETATTARGNFDRLWTGSGTPARNQGILQSVFRSLASTLNLFNGRGRRADWVYRPEYKSGSNVYKYMVLDGQGTLSYTGIKPLYKNGSVSTGKFYNDSRDPLNYGDLAARDREQTNALNAWYQEAAEAEQEAIASGQSASSFIPERPVQNDYSTAVKTTDINRNFASGYRDQDERYASPRIMADRYSKDKNDDQGIVALYKRMKDAMVGGGVDGGQHPMYNKSAERYTYKEQAEVYDANNYKKIPDSAVGNGPYLQFIAGKSGAPTAITLDDRGFAKASKERDEAGSTDVYNAGDITEDKEDLNIGSQSQDLIYFYFHDLVNNKYIPFRATITSIQDQHSPEYDDIKYMGRADRTFIYKGFTRDVNFGFRVYANSIEELVPMWKRINYMTGLTRPSRYTDRATILRTNRSANVNPLLVDAPILQEPATTTAETTGLESGFIYPPMIEFRIGDLYVDQPAILGSVNVNIPEDATWETLRADEYSYIYGEDKEIRKSDATSRQLPNMVDITVQLKMLEKERSETGKNHFGPKDGWENVL